MNQIETFKFKSAYSDNQIYAIRYIPKSKVKAIVQISHGMVEYINRYEDFALYLNQFGILVTGNDHLGHGQSVKTKDDWGYFAKENGNEEMIANILKLTQITKEKYPDIPYFILGHSMGSFYARQYIALHGQEVDGAIIMGTGFPSYFAVTGGMIITKIIALFKGWHYRSSLVDKLAFGGYNKKFEPARTSKDWLSSDPKQVDKYIDTESCSFTFTINGYYNMFKGIKNLHKKNFINKMPKDLPILFVSGSEDPVGDFTKGVKKTIKNFKDIGMNDVEYIFYEKGRHEILNELNNKIVYEDILNWILKKL